MRSNYFAPSSCSLRHMKMRQKRSNLATYMKLNGAEKVLNLEDLNLKYF